VLVYGPMAHGLLAGAMTPATSFAAGDWRATSDLFRGETFRHNLQIVDELREVAQQRGHSVAQLAIAWTLANPAVDVAIVGARRPAQIEQTAPAAEIRLATRDLSEIDRIAGGAASAGGPAPELMPSAGVAR
jgi:aryl-alcohol dehydrogenase-like predicted oxidoreductase